MGNPFVDIVCPLFGNILGVTMLCSPIAAVLRIRRSGTLGAINPLPYPFTFMNCFGWVVYGLVLQNPWISPANIIGAVAGIAFTLVSLPHASRKDQDIMTGLMVGSIAYFGILGMIGTFAMEGDQRAQLWGIQCVVVLMCYYVIPLSTLWQIIRTKDASSIYLPLAVAAVANGTMWALYGGFGTHDPNLWIPNGLGALLGVSQVLLRLCYGSKGGGAADVLPSSQSQLVEADLTVRPSLVDASSPASKAVPIDMRQSSESGMGLLEHQQKVGAASSFTQPVIGQPYTNGNHR